MTTIYAAIDSSRAKIGAQQFRQATETMGQSATRAQARMRGMQTSMAGVGATATKVKGLVAGMFGGLAAAAGLRSAIRTIASFEETMATVQGVTKASAAEFNALSDAARELGATTRFSATEAGEGLLFLARAGFEASEAIEALPATLNLAQAGVMDLGAAADLASNVLTQFGLSAAETERVVDTLLNTSNTTNTNVAQLGEAMKLAGLTAGSMGVDVETAAAAIGVLGDAGVQATMAGTNLRGVLLGLSAPSSQGAAAIGDLGLKLNEINPVTVGFEQAFRNLGMAIEDIEPEDAIAAFDAIFGRRNIGAALAFAENIDRVYEVTEANREATHEAERMARIMDDTLVGAWKNLKSAMAEAALQIGEAGFGGSLRSTVDTVTGAIRILVGMENTVERNVEAAHNLADAMRLIGAGIAGILAMKLAVYFAGAAKAALAFTAALATNPLGLLAVAISSAVAALIYFRDETLTIGETSATVGAWVMSTWDAVVERISIVMNALVAAMKFTWESISELAGKAWDTVLEYFNAFSATFSVDWGSTIQWMADTLRTGVNLMIGTMVGLLDVISSAVKGAYEFTSLAAKLASGEMDLLSAPAALARMAQLINPETVLEAGLSKLSDSLRRDYVDEFVDFGERAWAGFVTGFEAMLYAQGIDPKLVAEAFDLDAMLDEIAAGSQNRQYAGVPFIPEPRIVTEGQEGFVGPRYVPTPPEAGIQDAAAQYVEQERAMDKTIATLGEMIGLVQKEAELVNMTNEEREKAIALREVENLTAGQSSFAITALVEKYEDEIDAIQRAANMRRLGEDIGSAIGRGVTEAIMHFENFRDIAIAVVQDISRALIDELISKQIAKGVAGFVGGLNFGPAAHGALVGPGYGVEYMAQGGITDRPTAVGMVGSRVAISSEFGQREFVMPAHRTSGGDLGVKVQLPEQQLRPQTTIVQNFPNVRTTDDFRRAARHQASDMRRRAGAR